jgi:hypothetical protein
MVEDTCSGASQQGDAQVITHAAIELEAISFSKSDILRHTL